MFFYGEATHPHIRRLEMLRTKTKLLCTLPFLLRCRDHSTFPHFLQFQHHKKSDGASRIYRCTSFCLLCERIHHTRQELDAVSKELFKLHLRLAQDLFADDWDLIDRITTEKALCTADDIRATLCRKLKHLHKTQHPPRPPENKKIVVNLSEVALKEAACLALSKGLNIAVSPAFVPIKDILCRVEKATGALPEETAEEIRQETVRILKGYYKPKGNLTGAERRDLRGLKANEALTELPASPSLLKNKEYKKMKKDPTDSLERKTVLLLKKPLIAEVCQQL
jgi:hypothetical protein